MLVSLPEFSAQLCGASFEFNIIFLPSCFVRLEEKPSFGARTETGRRYSFFFVKINRRDYSSAGLERYLDMVEVVGSNPSSLTTKA